MTKHKTGRTEQDLKAFCKKQGVSFADKMIGKWKGQSIAVQGAIDGLVNYYGYKRSQA